MGALPLNVSRETLEKLEAYVRLVEKWTVKINLVSKHTVSELWDRHIIDSAQLYELAPRGGTWADLGSGGGFPGIVAAILSEGEGGGHNFVLVESDQRKAVFLRTAIRELGLRVKVQSSRIENIDPLAANILSARALADLDTLLGFADLHLATDGVALFLKGEQWEKEHSAARLRWSYRCDVIKSVTNPKAAVLKLKEIARV